MNDVATATKHTHTHTAHQLRCPLDLMREAARVVSTDVFSSFKVLTLFQINFVKGFVLMRYSLDCKQLASLNLTPHEQLTFTYDKVLYSTAFITLQAQKALPAKRAWAPRRDPYGNGSGFEKIVFFHPSPILTKE